MKKRSDKSLPRSMDTTNNPPPPITNVPAPSATEVKKMNTGTMKGKRKSNTNEFGNDFLIDFKLFHGKLKLDDGTWPKGNEWIYSKKAIERFHQPVTYKSPNGSEGPKHYGLKQVVHDYIYDNYYLQNGCKFLVTTELEQKNNPFYSYIDGKIPVFFTMDICVIRESDRQVFNIEIDGPEHYTRGGMMKAEIRDEWLLDRYGVLTYRIDQADDEPNYKKIDKFITTSPTVKNTRKRY